MGENFVVSHFFGDIRPWTSEIVYLCSLSLSLSLSSQRSLSPRRLLGQGQKRVLPPHGAHAPEPEQSREGAHGAEAAAPPVDFSNAGAILIQIARGTEYLREKQIYLGNLSSATVLLKRVDNHVRVKVTAE